MDILEQIGAGRLVSPRTHEELEFDSEENVLVGRTTGERFAMWDKRVPILLKDVQWAKKYVDASPEMLGQYCGKTGERPAKRRWSRKSVGSLYAARANNAMNSILDPQPADAICLSIGGGPTRAHPRLCNLNLGPFANVDLVADAHALPYADGSVDAIHCSAVIEHLHTPDLAVAEMYRVLKPGGQAFVSTPFMQLYHGYPNHYQNYTITGHQLLFTRHGFEIIEADVSVGPAHAVSQLVDQFIREYLRGPKRWLFRRLWRLATPSVRRADTDPQAGAKAHVMASATYLVARRAG